MNEVEKRQVKGIWIPIEVWESTDLHMAEKLVLAEIDSFEKSQGCFVSNGYLGRFLDLSPSRISQIVSHLKELGYISVEIIYKTGSKEVDRRIIKINKEKIYNLEK
jgi:Mn-dependent DtxR family transcriptional regulator